MIKSGMAQTSNAMLVSMWQKHNLSLGAAKMCAKNANIMFIYIYVHVNIHDSINLKGLSLLTNISILFISRSFFIRTISIQFKYKCVYKGIY